METIQEETLFEYMTELSEIIEYSDSDSDISISSSIILESIIEDDNYDQWYQNHS